jgi:hypothetical protein
MLVLPSNDLRINCKRLAGLALTYVPPPAIGGWWSSELKPEALAGCMRLLGGAADSCRHATMVKRCLMVLLRLRRSGMTDHAKRDQTHKQCCQDEG